MHYKAKKKFGQNFLKDSFFLRQIVQAIPNTSSQVVEIGIGLGDLTDELLKIHNLIAYEEMRTYVLCLLKDTLVC